MNSRIDGKDLDELLEDLGKVAQPGSVVHELQKTAINVKIAEMVSDSIISLEQSMNRNAESSDRLSKKVYWLNIILTVVTVIMTALTLGLFIRA